MYTNVIQIVNFEQSLILIRNQLHVLYSDFNDIKDTLQPESLLGICGSPHVKETQLNPHTVMAVFFGAPKGPVN